MSDLPRSIRITEEGPREGFQIEPGPIPTARKIEFINALGQTGLKRIQTASFVNPKRVPGWADADAVEGARHHGFTACHWVTAMRGRSARRRPTCVRCEISMRTMSPPCFS